VFYDVGGTWTISQELLDCIIFFSILSCSVLIDLKKKKKKATISGYRGELEVPPVTVSVSHHRVLHL